MKETRFIAQNKEKWQESENLLEDPVKDPEKLSNLFIQVVDDLSYSRTYYQNRSVRVYLNRIAREYFSIIYSHQKERKNTVRAFWLNELPQIMWFSRRQMLLSLAIFLFAAAVGIFSAIKDPHFTNTILGDEYIAMTKENIQNGDPMAVYKKGHQVDMFLGITLNNLMVAFRTYVLGIFLSIGTVAIMLYNGIMVGCFQYFFIERGLFAQSALTIWLHGTLEISSIILAGGAGLTLGSGLIFPGTYSRLQAFQLSAIRSLKLMLGITPIFVLAAIIESFLTRYTDVPDVLRLFLILLSAAFIAGYFVLYPWLRSRRGFDQPLKETRLAPNPPENIAFERIKNNAEIIKDTFTFYKRYFTPLFSRIAFITLLIAAAEIVVRETLISSRISLNFGFFPSLLQEMYYAIDTPLPVFVLIRGIGTALIVYQVMIRLDRHAKQGSSARIDWASLFQIAVLFSCFYYIRYSLRGWGILIDLLIFGFLLLWSFTLLTRHTNLFTGVANTWRLCIDRFGSLLGLQFILLLMISSFLLVISAPLVYINTEVLSWNFAESDAWSKYIVNFVTIYLKVLAFNLVSPIVAASMGLLYFSLLEIRDAGHLKESIAGIGSKWMKRSRA